MPDVLCEEDYLPDLTKSYHNLLGVKKNGTSQTFYYDNSVSAMEENGHFHYYLLDELGSPLCVSDWETPENGAAGKSNYLTYGYDEFGNDLGKELEQAGIPNPYSSQGEDQPFGYTGYRYDNTAATYFAQAREYNPKTGRFTAEDIIKGNGLIPETLNPYVYCWNSPLGLVDLDELLPAWLDGIYAHALFEAKFKFMYNKENGTAKTETIYGRTEVVIPGGGRYGLDGRADVVLYDGNSASIYEIKPISNYYNPTLRDKADAQLENYITAYKKTKTHVYEGDRLYVEPLLEQESIFPYDVNKTIKYMMFADSPGMIYYEITEKEEGERETAWATAVVPREVTEVEQVGMAVVILSMLSSMKEQAVAVANGFFAPIIMFDEILEQNMKRVNGCKHEKGECTCVA